MERQADLVVVGCGAGGLATAVRFLESAPGASAVVLERAPRERRGGNTAWTGAFFRLEPDGTPAPDFEERMHELSGGRTDKQIIRRLAENAKPTIQWLHAQGVETIAGPTYFLTSQGPRLMPSGGGGAIVDRLCARVTELGGTIEYEATAKALLREEGGSVRGVVGVDADGRERTWRATTVVLACGGFEGGADLLRDATPIPGLYAVGEIAGIYHREYPGATSVLRALVFGRIAGEQAAARAAVSGT